MAQTSGTKRSDSLTNRTGKTIKTERAVRLSLNYYNLVSVPCTAIILAKSKDTHDFIIECIPGYLLGTLILKIVPVQVLELMVCAMLVCFIIMRYRSGASSYRLPESSAIGIGTGVVSGTNLG